MLLTPSTNLFSQSHAVSRSSPLLLVSADKIIGDLGVTASDVESRLETNFTLAHRWGCVLLLDEADIFLAERTKDDFLRNSLVSGWFET